MRCFSLYKKQPSILITLFVKKGFNLDILDVFSKNVRTYRNELGISQEELGYRSGLHRTYISDIERKKRSISLINIQKIADALKIETYKLFEEDNNEK